MPITSILPDISAFQTNEQTTKTMHYVDRLTTSADFIYSLFFRIFAAAEAPIDWEPVDVSPVKQVNFELSIVFFSRGQNFQVFTSLGQADGTMGIPKAAIDSVNKNGIGLKSPLMTPVGKGFRSLNLALRKEFSLYANVRPCKSLEGYKTLYDNVDVVTIR